MPISIVFFVASLIDNIQFILHLAVTSQMYLISCYSRYKYYTSMQIPMCCSLQNSKKGSNLDKFSTPITLDEHIISSIYILQVHHVITKKEHIKGLS